MKWVGALMLLIATSGCAARRYAGRGLVVDVDRSAGTVTVSHDAIRGFMDAMVMPFPVRDPRELDRVRRGDRVQFRLAVAHGQSQLDSLRVVSAAPVEPEKWQSPVVSKLVPVGAPVPDFVLTDSAEQAVALSGLRGKIVAVNFIYTRCPLPDYCPRMTANFLALRRRFEPLLAKDLVLLSVTLDPQYDSPDVLGRYARMSRAVVEGWHFLTGSRPDIARVCGLFGMEFWPEEGSITHNLITALIDRDGRLAARVEGKDYPAAQLGDLVARLLEDPQARR
jgi:protein SCO1/2